MFCYLDDIIIASHSLEEHIEHLRQIFTILQENGLQINLAKCVFAAAALEFLGHRVDQDGVRPLQRHIKAISDFPPPSGCETITTVFRYCEFLQTVPSRYRLHAVAAHRRAQGCPQDAEVANCPLLPSLPRTGRKRGWQLRNGPSWLPSPMRSRSTFL